MIFINFIKLRARAKINIALDILGQLPNGYHDLKMIMQTVNLCDYVFIKKISEPAIRIKTNLSWLPNDERNLAYKAAQAMKEKYGISSGIYIDISKNIPVAAGLAGGSADCAAVLVGINLLFNINASNEELMKIGVKLGADVPYCIMRGTVLAEGIGEKLTPLPNFPFCHIVLCKPYANVSTAAVFSAYDSNEAKEHPDAEYLMSQIKSGNLKEISENMGNVLETVTIKELPIINDIKKIMLEKGALGSIMSGSGPTVFGIFDSKSKAIEAAKALKSILHINQTYFTTVYNPKRR